MNKKVVHKLSKWRLFIVYLMSIFCLNSVFAVQVAEKTPSAIEQGFGVMVLTVLVMVVIGAVFILIFLYAIIIIFKKLSYHNRRNVDYRFEEFTLDNEQALMNRDRELKKRNWLYFFIFWKRSPVYAYTKNGAQMIGQYNGEVRKKENFYFISLHYKISMFKSIEKLLIIPHELEFSVQKLFFGKNKVMFIECEGVDRFSNTDYYLLPLIIDRTNKQKFLDLTEIVKKSYIELNTYRNIISDNLGEFKQGITKAVEMNPNINYKRRSE